jgi:hypothetical protein
MVGGNMQGARVSKDGAVLLLWGDPKERQSLYKVLCATGADVRFVENEGGPDSKLLESCRLVVVDYDTLPEHSLALLSELSRRPNKPRVLVVTSTRDKKDLIELLSHEALTNLVARNTAIHPTELIVTVQKLMRHDIFGLEKYLTWGVQVREHVVTSSRQKNGVLDGLDAYMGAIGCNKRLAGLGRGVADEFLMNAIYNAPVDGKGTPKYARRARSEDVNLEKGEEVRFRYACDGRWLVMSVEDNFGRLERDTVVRYLRKCFMGGENQIDTKAGGAGLGLYYMFESLNQFIINLAKNKRTEMLGILDVSGSYRDFAEKPKSLNIFLQEDAT